MNQLQNRLFEMFVWLSSFLDSHGLRYFACGGTLLGAIRHNGFIPWDDDMDIAMPRNDYQKCLELLKEPIDGYVVESITSPNKDFLYLNAKFYDMNTTMIEKIRVNVKRGIYIDIFPLDGIGDSYNEGVKKYLKTCKKIQLLTTRICAIRKERTLSKNAAIILGRLIPNFIINEKKLAIEIDKECMMYDYDESRFVGPLTGAYQPWVIVDKTNYGTAKRVPFESSTILVPENYDYILTNQYHNWRALPPEEKRGHQHDYLEIDFSKPYYEK